MESQNCPHPSSNLIHSEDGQDINLSRKHSKTKQKRKSSTVSVREGEKTKSRKASKGKPSLADIEQEVSDAQACMTNCNLQSTDKDHPATLKLLQDEQKDTSPKVTPNLMQMTLDEEDNVQPMQRNEATANLQNDEKIQDDVKPVNETIIEEEISASKEAEQRNAQLEEKFDQDEEFNISNTMDLSSSNLTDKDIPLIIQRAFRKEKKKYTYLVLRDNALTSLGVKILVDQLLELPTGLKNLSLSSNPGIGDVGIEHLVRLLQGTRSITILALHNTGITDRGVRLLADVLCDTDTKSISPLAKLYISFNKSITDESLEALIQILEQNQTLKLLSLQRCSLSDRARRRLKQITTKKKKRKFTLQD